VAEWLLEHAKSKKELDTEGIELAAAVNAGLSYRRHARRLSQNDLALVEELCGETPRP
jgi:hypothetical protein